MAIQTFVLACGMPLIVEANASVKSAAVCWLLPAGSAHDAADRQGMSTMLSELIFRGAGARDSRAQADAMDSIGLVRGCSVGMVYLRLTASMIAREIDGALELMSDMVLRPKFEEGAVEPARELALQSLAGLKDDPASRAGVMINQRHAMVPFNRSGLGEEGGLRAITHAEIKGAWARHVRPRGSILAVAGDVDAVALVKKLDALLQGWEGTCGEPAMSENPFKGTYHHEMDESAQAQIYVCGDAPSENHADAKFERIVTAVLSGGSSSRLFSEVREKRGLCYSVSAGFSSDKRFGRLTAYVGTTPPRAQESLDVLLSELDRISTAAGAVTPEEFQRAVIGHKSGLVFSGESMASRAGSLAVDQHRIGRPRSLDELAREVDGITLGDVNAYLARRLKPVRTIVTLGAAPLVVKGA